MRTLVLTDSLVKMIVKYTEEHIVLIVCYR